MNRINIRKEVDKIVVEIDVRDFKQKDIDFIIDEVRRSVDIAVTLIRATHRQ